MTFEDLILNFKNLLTLMIYKTEKTEKRRKLCENHPKDWVQNTERVDVKWWKCGESLATWTRESV